MESRAEKPKPFLRLSVSPFGTYWQLWAPTGAGSACCVTAFDTKELAEEAMTRLLAMPLKGANDWGSLALANL